MFGECFTGHAGADVVDEVGDRDELSSADACAHDGTLRGFCEQSSDDADRQQGDISTMSSGSSMLNR
jgi:hypothetical protein